MEMVGPGGQGGTTGYYKQWPVAGEKNNEFCELYFNLRVCTVWMHVVKFFEWLR